MLKPLVKNALIIALIATSYGYVNAQVSFTEYVVDDYFDRVAGLYVADIDGDGHKDIIGAAINANEIAWWRNDGTDPINWIKYSVDNQFSGAIWVQCADVDGDSRIDILGAAATANEIAWWKNNGGNPITWTKQVIRYNFTSAHGAFACDIDLDGDIDVLGASEALGQIIWCLNEGGEPIEWTPVVIDYGFGGARTVSAADADGDGDIDIFGAAFNIGKIRWWRNDGGEPIDWTPIDIDPGFTGAHNLHICDMDNDDDPDIIAAAYTISQVAWWRNDQGDPVTWTKTIVDNYVGGALTVHSGDLDNDGDMDIAGSAWGVHDLIWWANPGEEPLDWARHPLDENYRGAWPVCIDDIDGDGDNDIVSGADTDNDVTFWKNDYYDFGFTAEPISGNIPLLVQFQDLSHSAWPIQSWAWDFDGDGEFDSYEQNPSWIYNEPGSYSVALEVTANDVNHCVTYSHYIRVFPGYSALQFNGESSYASVEASSSLNITNQLTFEAWINPYNWGPNMTMGLGQVVEKTSFSVFLVKESITLNDHSLVFYMTNNENQGFMINTPANSIALNTWQHIAITYDYTGEPAIFIDGIGQDLSFTNPPIGPIQDNSLADLLIGCNDNPGGYFDGIIDEVRIWNIIRSGNNIQAFMNHYLNGNESGLIGYWRMDEANGNVINDRSEYENDGTAYNTEWTDGIELNPVSIKQSSTADHQNEVVIARAFPNPSNAAVRIDYSLKSNSPVMIIFYDILGRKISELNQGFLRAGKYSINWETDSLPSGLYMYKIQAGNRSYLDKVILLK